MKQTKYICNKCKREIRNDIYTLFVGMIDKETDEISDDGTFYLEETGEVHLCGTCLAQVDSELTKILSKGVVSENITKDTRNKRKVNLDINEVIDMRNRGVSLEVISKRFGCSPQTIQNHLIKIGYYKTNDKGEIVL